MSEKMDVWALVEIGQPLQKIQQPIPVPQGTEVLIRVTHSGVCHSDLHIVDGFLDLGGDQKLSVLDLGVKPPVALGHEILGTVAQLGPDVSPEDTIPTGASRIVYPWLGCGECRRCTGGEDNLCAHPRSLGLAQNGGFASYVVVPHPRYLVDPAGVDPLVASTFGCSGLTAYSAVTSAVPDDPDSAVVLIGAGGLGLAGISTLRALGHRNIVSVDVNDTKLAAAKTAGATAVVNTHGLQGDESAGRITAATGGPVQGVVDFVNTTDTAGTAYAILAPSAIWVQVGVMGGTFPLPLAATVLRAVTIKGNLVGTLAQLAEVAALAHAGDLPPVPVTPVPWDDVNDALDRLRRGEVTGRIVLVRS